jgi:hypothetical protein
MDCLTRTIARIAIAEITASTVDWINSGFDGKPAFIENYEQFFTSVADQAAGEFIQGSALSFLCSPFQLQVKVAIAQSYAKRRSGESNQCSLSSVVGNVEGFLAGDFAEGGWPGLISLTTVPTNNPFGAYMYAQAGLESAQVRATTEANRRITPGGFLAQQDCGAGVEGTSVNVGCKIILPGAAIEDSLENALGTSLDSLQLADHFDEIIAALINQLMTKVLYEGLSNVSGPNGYQDTFINPINTQATEAAKTLLREMQQSVSIAQQYGGVEQGSIGDIQNVQQSLTELQNCWVLQGADAQASEAEARRTALEPRIAIYNSNITRASSAISKVEQLHTSLLSAKSLSDVQAVRSQFGTAQSSGQLVSQTEITSAQQDRTTLQVEMGTIAGQTAAQLNQCYAS